MTTPALCAIINGKSSSASGSLQGLLCNLTGRTPLPPIGGRNVEKFENRRRGRMSRAAQKGEDRKMGLDLQNERNLTMLTDFYELTMSNGYLESGMDDKIGVFDMFFRKIPDEMCIRDRSSTASSTAWAPLLTLCCWTP